METDDLNELVRRLNAEVGAPGDPARSDRAEGEERRRETPDASESGAPLPTAEPPWEASPLTPPDDETRLAPRLAAWLAELVRREGTDLLLVPGAAPTARVHGRLQPLGREAEPLGPDDAARLVEPLLSPIRLRRFRESGAVDLSVRLPDLGRFRTNLHRTRAGSAAALRLLPRRIPGLEELGLPTALYELVGATRGLVLVTGPTGSGKTTTLASLVDWINETEQRHIVTIEDPVEYEHGHKKSVVEQIEVGSDAPSFAAALVAALRQDPDVLLVGEIRDLQTVRTALTAAETGHLVLTTLHTNDAAQTLHRLVDLFAGDQQGQIRQQLSLALSAIVSQQLVPRKDGPGRVLACEILVATDGVRNHIRKGTIHQLHSEMTLGRRRGMLTLEDSLAALVRAGRISEAEARSRASHPDDLASALRG